MSLFSRNFIVALCVALHISSSASAQMMMTGAGAQSKVAAGGCVNLAETCAWAAQVVTNGGAAPSSTQKGFVDTLVTAIKTNLGPNLNSKLDRMFLLANFDNNETAAFTDLINPTTSTLATKTGSFTSTTLGYQSNGTTGFIDTKFNPNTNGVTHTTNSNSVGIYDLTSNTGTGSNISVGAYDGTNFTQVIPLFAPVGSAFINAGGTSVDNTNTNSQGFHVATRIDGTHAQYKIFQLTGNLDSGSHAATATALANTTFFVCGRHNTTLGSPFADSFWPGKLALAFFGGNLTTTNMNDLSAAVNAYMTSLGINVY